MGTGSQKEDPMNEQVFSWSNFKRVWTALGCVLFLFSLELPAPAAAQIVNSSPFLGQWESTIDGSKSSLTITSAGVDSFRLIWREGSSPACSGGPSLARGTAQPNAIKAYMLESKLQIAC